MQGAMCEQLLSRRLLVAMLAVPKALCCLRLAAMALQHQCAKLPAARSGEAHMPLRLPSVQLLP